MEKINLSVQRSFSDLITVTINFMKQEFVPFIRAFLLPRTRQKHRLK